LAGFFIVYRGLRLSGSVDQVVAQRVEAVAVKLDIEALFQAIILAHGYATASSIANVANRLLKSQLFESFDMPLDVTPEAIA
ncbi:hypothetical protein, partial [Klebsiella pneumoniae]|uniref:hypothetical protein n=1 Tax=Klebsiella pneumoniae TaxID=573 RepID=UPI001C582F55